MKPPSPPRRHDLDALRIFACYLLFLFHVAMVFNPAPFYHVRNDETNLAFLIVCGFIGLWHMPLFFLLAGWSAAASPKSRGAKSFLRERWHKLAVPLVACCVLLVAVVGAFDWTPPGWGGPAPYARLSGRAWSRRCCWCLLLPAPTTPRVSGGPTGPPPERTARRCAWTGPTSSGCVAIWASGSWAGPPAGSA